MGRGSSFHHHCNGEFGEGGRKFRRVKIANKDFGGFLHGKKDLLPLLEKGREVFHYLRTREKT